MKWTPIAPAILDRRWRQISRDVEQASDGLSKDRLTAMLEVNWFAVARNPASSRVDEQSRNLTPWPTVGGSELRLIPALMPVLQSLLGDSRMRPIEGRRFERMHPGAHKTTARICSK